MNKERAEQILSWKKSGMTFRKLAQTYSEYYNENYTSQEDGIAMTQEALETLGRDPSECWND